MFRCIFSGQCTLKRITLTLATPAARSKRSYGHLPVTIVGLTHVLLLFVGESPAAIWELRLCLRVKELEQQMTKLKGQMQEALDEVDTQKSNLHLERTVLEREREKLNETKSKLDKCALVSLDVVQSPPHC